MKVLKYIIKYLLIIIITTAIVVCPFHALFYLMPCELVTTDNLLAIIGLFIGYFTLWATIFIAIFIYWLQKRNVEIEDNRRSERAKAAILLELENALEMYLFMPEENRDGHYCDGIKEVLSTNAGELKKVISTEKFHLLIEIVNTIHKNDTVGASRYIRDWLQILYLSEFQQYFVCALDYTECLEKHTFELITELRGGKSKYKELNSIVGNGGKILFEKHGEYVKITCDDKIQLDGKLGYNGIIDEPVIMDGFGRNEEYVGHYKNGFYEGEGTQLDIFGKKLREGIWAEGELVSGIEYNQLIYVTKGKLIYRKEQPEDPYDATKDFEYEKLELYGDRTIIPLRMSILHIKQNNIASYYIVDMKLTETTQQPTNIRTLEEFLRKNNPELLKQLMEDE